MQYPCPGGAWKVVSRRSGCATSMIRAREGCSSGLLSVGRAVCGLIAGSVNDSTSTSVNEGDQRATRERSDDVSDRYSEYGGAPCLCLPS